MSYARFRAGESDVYVFENSGGYLECCGCILNRPLRELDPMVETVREMVDHLQAHREAGHLVPEGLTDALLHDADWLEPEMAKMRAEWSKSPEAMGIRKLSREQLLRLFPPRKPTPATKP